jgi:hypothetical protein
MARTYFDKDAGSVEQLWASDGATGGARLVESFASSAFAAR